MAKNPTLLLSCGWGQIHLQTTKIKSFLISSYSEYLKYRKIASLDRWDNKQNVLIHILINILTKFSSIITARTVKVGPVIIQWGLNIV